MTLKTALLSDALGKAGAMDHEIKCVSANCRMAGRAATLRVHTADILMVGKAVSMCPKGRVLVIDGQGELNTTLWGILIVPADRLSAILKAADELKAVEKNIERAIRRGNDFGFLLRYDGVLEEKAKGVFLPQMRFKHY